MPTRKRSPYGGDCCLKSEKRPTCVVILYIIHPSFARTLDGPDVPPAQQDRVAPAATQFCCDLRWPRPNNFIACSGGEYREEERESETENGQHGTKRHRGDAGKYKSQSGADASQFPMSKPPHVGEDDLPLLLFDLNGASDFQFPLANANL